MNDIEGRRPFRGLSEEEVELLVGRVSQRVLENFYQEVGRSVMSKVLWVIGLVTVSLVIWLTSTGRMKGLTP